MKQRGAAQTIVASCCCAALIACQRQPPANESAGANKSLATATTSPALVVASSTGTGVAAKAGSPSNADNPASASNAGSPGNAAEQVQLGLAAQANLGFSARLFNQLTRKPKTGPVSNVLFAPASVHLALAATWLGAKGATAQELADVLALPGERSNVEDALGAQVVTWRAAGSAVSLATGAFFPKAVALSPEFTSNSQRLFQARVEGLDFVQPEHARSQINTWVKTNTAGQIDNLIPAGTLSQNTRFVLANACYFKGLWQAPFDSKLSKAGKFQLGSGGSVPIVLMQQQSTFAYGATTLGSVPVRALELPYAGGAFSLLIAMPESIPSSWLLTAADLEALPKQLRQQTVKLELPRLKLSLTESMDLVPTLKQLGLRHLFSDADLSGITGQAGQLAVSAVFHNARVEFDEAGTTAAAATAVVVSKSLATPVSFSVDRPFAFFVRDQRNGAILFAGLVHTPPPAVQDN